MTATACSDDDAAQRWWANAVGLPKDWPTTAGNVRLESAFKGGRLRRSGSVPGTGVYTQPTPPWWWIYWLAYERKDLGWNIQQIAPGGNLVRFQSLDGDNRCLGVRSERARSRTDAVLRTCDDARRRRDRPAPVGQDLCGRHHPLPQRSQPPVSARPRRQPWQCQPRFVQRQPGRAMEGGGP
ncbi:hypothetical protein [Streptomyces triticiradicis]|uniref:Uncharacterized protein n=1 Tax=Streptomyces triticiradicis TaxID=2651189 RepID=A0A7J5D982_9ACTN|nr:hypothetical protein [Streptomyces triticiradicis]KAB1984255.1 hypothetical protein F8144_28970 [Streptomyces triticiradicis]